MTETGKILFAIILLAFVYVFTRKFHGWRMRRTLAAILKDLENKEAVDHSSAVKLPYAGVRVFRVGMRDYRPKAVEYLVSSNVVGMTGDGRYYLKTKSREVPGLD